MQALAGITSHHMADENRLWDMRLSLESVARMLFDVEGDQECRRYGLTNDSDSDKVYHLSSHVLGMLKDFLFFLERDQHKGLANCGIGAIKRPRSWGDIHLDCTLGPRREMEFLQVVEEKTADIALEGSSSQPTLREHNGGVGSRASMENVGPIL